MKNEKPLRHWSRNLPEVGKIMLIRAEHQEHRLLTIERMRQEIQNLRKQVDEQEQEIFKLAESEWSDQDIQNAIKQSM